ncbi:hypothetical protein TN45_25455 [Pseudomonas aeruginosa]|nr:hypothetical protein TN45_25455 [Pseudomonas aeruginosa]
MENPPMLTTEQISQHIHAKIDGYKGLSLLERFAMFMGKAQILEFGLKNLLGRRFNVPTEKMEKWTLGMTKNELKVKGIRPDFIALLDNFVGQRNYIAHEFLLDHSITNSFIGLSGRKLEGILFRATYELEKIILLHDWCEEHNGWT